MILEEIQDKVLEQQKEFDRIWNEILRELKKQKIYLINETQLNGTQKKFVLDYFNEEVRSNMVPLMIESIQAFPALNDKSFILPVHFQKKTKAFPNVLHWYQYQPGGCQDLSYFLQDKMKSTSFCWKILSVIACRIFFLFLNTILFHLTLLK